MKRILVGLLFVVSLITAAPAHADHARQAGPARPCRPNAIHHVMLRLERQEAAGHDRRCARMERHLAMLMTDCEAPAP